MTRLISHRTIVTGVSKHAERTVHHTAPLRSMLRFPLTVQLIETTSGYWLFDTGVSDHMQRLQSGLWSRAYKHVVPFEMPAGGSAIEQAAQLGVSKHDITHVVLSHFHADHIGALRDFPNATIMGMGSGLTELQRARGISAARHALFDVLLPDDVQDRFVSIDGRATMTLEWSGWENVGAWRLSDDDSIVAVDLPGHSTGQVGLLLGGPHGTFHVADAAWTTTAIRDRIRPSHISRLVHRDWGDYLATLDRLHALWDSGPTILPCHCHEAHPESQ